MNGESFWVVQRCTTIYNTKRYIKTYRSADVISLFYIKYERKKNWNKSHCCTLQYFNTRKFIS